MWFSGWEPGIPPLPTSLATTLLPSPLTNVVLGYIPRDPCLYLQGRKDLKTLTLLLQSSSLYHHYCLVQASSIPLLLFAF